MKDCNFYIITVPTPIDDAKRPDLTPLQKASEMTGGFLKKGDTVVYESTVYPGATEEVCVPILEAKSGLKFNVDFFAGYSPERVNPADPNRKLPDIKKVTSGSTPEVADLVDEIYATGHHSWHAQGQFNPRCRSFQGHRKRTARREYCANE